MVDNSPLGHQQDEELDLFLHKIHELLLQEPSEDIEIIIADRKECRRILAEENVAIKCAYLLMQFIHSTGDPLDL